VLVLILFQSKYATIARRWQVIRMQLFLNYILTTRNTRNGTRGFWAVVIYQWKNGDLAALQTVSYI